MKNKKTEETTKTIKITKKIRQLLDKMEMYEERSKKEWGKPIKDRYITLYHGTNKKNLEKILKEGIKPRGNKKSNWKRNSIGTSRSDLVYLTKCYACYYASASCKKDGDVPVVVKLNIDTRKIKLFMDEEFIFKDLYKSGRGLSKKKVVAIYNQINPRDYKGKKYWEMSLAFMGTVCAEYIPASSIVGYAELTELTPELYEHYDVMVGHENYYKKSAFYIDYLESLDYKKV